MVLVFIHIAADNGAHGRIQLTSMLMREKKKLKGKDGPADWVPSCGFHGYALA